QLQYRLSFVLTVIGHFFAIGVEFLGVWALFSRFGDMVPWTLAEVAFFYGAVNVGFSFADVFARSFHTFGSRFVVTGEFDRLLLRPRSTALQLAGHDVALVKLGRFLQGAIVLLVATMALDLDWSLGRVALLLFTLLAMSAFFYGLSIVQAVISFWT